LYSKFGLDLQSVIFEAYPQGIYHETHYTPILRIEKSEWHWNRPRWFFTNSVIKGAEGKYE
ncbi:MAG: hypothetical protein IJ803_11670, partial [Oribacterium sp.]|nr:hypothetical protein [Oribacterium sp.]